MRESRRRKCVGQDSWPGRAGEGGRRRRLDQDVDELARVPAPLKFTVVFRRVRPRLSVGIGAAGALDEDLLHPADALLVPLAGDALHGVDQSLDPLALDVLGHLVGHAAASVPPRGL